MKKIDKKKKTLVFIAGIRPDIIKPALILRYLQESKKINFIFIWSGQHHNENLIWVTMRDLQSHIRISIR